MHPISLFAHTDTHLNDSHLDAELKNRDFTAIRADRLGRRKGGVVFFHKDPFNANTKDTFSNGYNKSKELPAIGL